MPITLEDKIRLYVDLPSSPTSQGWYPVLHNCDHGRKGPRAAFKFDGDNVGFHCFNCPLKAKYTPSDNPYLSDKMKEVMEDFSIPESEYSEVVFQNLTNQPNKSKEEQNNKVNLEPEEIPLPEPFYLIKDASPKNAWVQIAKHYLEEERGLDSTTYPFMLCKKTSVKHLQKWHGRVIIPIYKDNKLIFYLGRDLTGKKTLKYESPAVGRDKILYGYNRLHENYEQPLYIVEGWFDGNAIDGVAIIGNEISETKAKILNRSRRKKVYVPDRFGSGIIAAKQALKYGWHISTPNIGSDCKDMSDAVQKYGKLYVLKTLADNTTNGFEAEVNLGIYCNK